MTRFHLYDTNGELRDIVINADSTSLRVWLTRFKTECAVHGKTYEFNHFKNWLNKYFDKTIEYYNPDNPKPERIDM